jgi:hypothetical protein
MSNENEQDNKQSERGGASSTLSAATSGAAEIVKRSRGRPKGSTNSASENSGGAASVSGEVAARQAELQAQFDRLYDPVVWEGIVAAPANIALAFTGAKIWDIPKEEIKTLSIQASVTARCFAVSDPKYLALTMLAISIITIYGGRTMQYYSEKADAQKAAGNSLPQSQ